MQYLTDLSFLNNGQRFPPESQCCRLEMYAKNKLLFEGEHENVYREQFKRIQRVIGNFDEVISIAVIINHQKLITLKVADLLLGEIPKIVAGEAKSREQICIDKIIENTDLHNTAYQVAIDVSRFGDGIFLIYKDIEFGQIDITRPEFWFPVVSSDNIKRIQYHVLAWTYMIGESKILKAQVHYKGYYDQSEYLIEDTLTACTIIRQYTETARVNTGLTDFAVIQVPNLITSDRVTGMDDYTDLDSIMAEIEVRLSQISRILDKHAAPSVSGPMSALEQDFKTGEWKLKMGNFFPRESSEDPDVKYVVWDGQLEANFLMLEKLINLLYTISEMGSAVFGDLSSKGGQIPSGSALRRLMISPLAKVNRIRMRFDPAMKKALKLCSQLGGRDIVNLTDKPITITWRDSLPADPVEESSIMFTRTQKPTMSVKRALNVYDDMTDEDADNEIDLIDEDEIKVNPLSAQSNPFSSVNSVNSDNKKVDE